MDGLVIVGIAGASTIGLTLAHKYNLLEVIGLPNPSGRWWWEPQPTNAQALSRVQTAQVRTMIQTAKAKTPIESGKYVVTAQPSRVPTKINAVGPYPGYYSQ